MWLCYISIIFLDIKFKSFNFTEIVVWAYHMLNIHIDQ